MDPTGPFFKAPSTSNDSLTPQGGARDKGKNSMRHGSALTQPSGKRRKDKPAKPQSYLRSLICTNHIWMYTDVTLIFVV